MFAVETLQGVISLPSLGTVPEDVVIVALEAPDNEKVWTLVEALAPRATLDVLDRLAVPYFREVVLKGWERHSDISIVDLFQIISIVRSPKYRDGLASDLIDRGLRLRDFPSDSHTWGDLKVIVKNLSVHSALYCVYYPDRAHWDLQNMLLADQVDALRWNNWSRTKDGAKNRKRPKPIPRPGITEDQRQGARVTAAPLSQIKAKMSARYAANNEANPNTNKLTAGLGRRLPVKQPQDRISSIADAFHGRG